MTKLEWKDYKKLAAEIPGVNLTAYKCFEELHGPYKVDCLDGKEVEFVWGRVFKPSGGDRFRSYSVVDGTTVGLFYHKTRAKEKLMAHVVRLILEM